MYDLSDCAVRESGRRPRVAVDENTRRTAKYVVPNQAETAKDAESTSEHQRIQQYAMFRFNS